ncbi:hypothetical protein C1H46_033622 [Malus baccata]|uniref:Uncharacterized protein n=1 Tax=Malus baccata TaxID=106549 RepID=A0A540L2S8_MALBA|nr:hypothetical protein C1H46_033622 [Malus baccata]
MALDWSCSQVKMASTEGMVPITRAFLASYYDTYQFPPLSNDIARLSAEIRSFTADLLPHSLAAQGHRNFKTLLKILHIFAKVINFFQFFACNLKNSISCIVNESNGFNF